MAFQILGDSVIDHNHIITSPKLILEGTSASESIISGLLNGESKLEIKSDGSASFTGLDMSGSIVPSVDNVYDLGSPTRMWRDVYIGPGSLYVNGQKIVEADDADNIILSSSSGQNLVLKPTGLGDLELAPEGGIVQVKSALQIQDGTNITNSAGNAISFSNNISSPALLVNEITSKSSDVDLVISGSGSGIVRISDGLNVVGTANVGALTIGGNSVDTSAQVDQKIADLVGTASSTLDTLGEIADALSDNQDVATSITVQLGLKANTSSLANVATSGSYTDLINKPSIPTHTSHLTNNSGYITSADGGNAATLDGIDSSQFLRSDTNDNLGGVLSYHSNDARLQFRNTSYNAYLYIGGWSTSNDNNISRIRNSNANLHLDSGANGHLYLNHYSSGNVYANGGNKVWHQGNDGSGSGLDADLLDGIQASSFLRSDANDNASGRLTINGAISSGSSAFLQVRGFSRMGAIAMHQSSAPTSGDGVPEATHKWLTNISGVLRWGTNATTADSTIWHSGNDGAGSGLDADLLDGIQASSFLRSDATDTSSQRISFQANATNNWDTIATSAGSQGCLEVYNSGAGTDAFMTFHVGGDYACYFGLDGGTNKLSVGGWSMGAASYEIYHAGNKPSLATLGYTGATNADHIGSTPTFTEVYNNGWFRNNQANEGLYNQATGAHWYSSADGYWNLTGNTQNQSTNLVFRGTHQGNVEGWIHSNGSGWLGFLNNAGQWALRHYNADGYSPNWYFDESGNETWTGNTGNDQGKIEYHSNRFYIVSGANSTEVVRFRRSTTDVGYVANDGNMYLTSSNHKVYHAGNKPSLATLGYTGATNANYITHTSQITNDSGYITNDISGGLTIRNSNLKFVTGSINGATNIHCNGSMRAEIYYDRTGNHNQLNLGATGYNYGMITGGTIASNGYGGRAGVNGSLGNTFNFEWRSDGYAYLWVDNTQVGRIYTVSDYRLKRNVTPLSNGALDRINQINPVEFQWDDFEKDNGDGEGGKTKICTKKEEKSEGFIAHELQEIIPSAVDGEKDDPVVMQSLQLDALLAVAVKAIQELSAKNDALEARIAQLESN